MTLPFLSADHLESFILVLVRVSAIIVVIPVLSEKNVPVMIKAGLAVIVSVVIFPLVAGTVPSTKNYHLFHLITLIAGEVLIGLTIGFTARLLFAAIQIAGDIIGFQMGFAVANVIDPMSEQSVSIITQLKYLIAMLLFITVNAHHLFFLAIIQSYQFVAPLSFHFSPESDAVYFYHIQRNVCHRPENSRAFNGRDDLYQCRTGCRGAHRAANEYFHCRLPSADIHGAHFHRADRTCIYTHDSGAFQFFGRKDNFRPAADVNVVHIA